MLNAEDGAAAGVVGATPAQILAAFSQAEGVGVVRRSAGSRGRAWPSRRGRSTTPRASTSAYMAIGLLASLVTLVGVLLTAQNIAREKEIGTLEQLNVTPITKGQFILGKLAPFWLLGLLELDARAGGDPLGVRHPVRRERGLWCTSGGRLPLAALGLGLLISTAVSTQQQAMFVTFFVRSDDVLPGRHLYARPVDAGLGAGGRPGQPDPPLRGGPAVGPDQGRHAPRGLAGASGRWPPSPPSCCRWRSSGTRRRRRSRHASDGGVASHSGGESDRRLGSVRLTRGVVIPKDRGSGE